MRVLGRASRRVAQSAALAAVLAHPGGWCAMWEGRGGVQHGMSNAENCQRRARRPGGQYVAVWWGLLSQPCILRCCQMGAGVRRTYRLLAPSHAPLQH